MTKPDGPGGSQRGGLFDDILDKVKDIISEDDDHPDKPVPHPPHEVDEDPAGSPMTSGPPPGYHDSELHKPPPVGGSTD